VPEIYYASSPANIRSARDRIVQSISFFANFDSGEAKMVDVKLVNGEQGYD